MLMEWAGHEPLDHRLETVGCFLEPLDTKLRFVKPGCRFFHAGVDGFHCLRHGFYSRSLLFHVQRNLLSALIRAADSGSDAGERFRGFLG